MQRSVVMKKLKSQKGFTLMEMLAAVLIMLLASGLILSCIQMALRHMDSDTKNAESQILCSSVSNYLQTELEYASRVQSADEYRREMIGTGLADEGFEVTTDPAADFIFFDRTGGLGSGCAIVNGGTAAGEIGRIYLYRNYPSDTKAVPLLNDAAYPNGLESYVQIRWNPEEERFDVTVEIRSSEADGKVRNRNDFYVYPLNP